MPDWERYATTRNLSRNRLLLAHHLEAVEGFVRFFGGIPNDRKVLEVGPAGGFFSLLLRELGFARVDALEISPEFCRQLRAKGLSVHEGDIASGRGLDALDAPYDVAILMEVLEHLPDPDAALRHVRGLLAPGGILYATVPARDCLFDKVRRLWSRRTRKEQVLEIDETHLHAFDAKGIRARVEGAGFDVASVRRVSLQPPFASRYEPGHRGFALLRAVLPRALRGYFVETVARRTA
jgi:2-polyprenyl-3-methyl-5-hydroxy-6-metoxy-1,4-benzoquinol methylase